MSDFEERFGKLTVIQKAENKNGLTHSIGVIGSFDGHICANNRITLNCNAKKQKLS